MPLASGDKLGEYEVVAPLGAGGMGEVYRARDTKLDREVAIKVLPEELSQDRDRLARFEREAKLLAGLNHPRIATLFGLESLDGRELLVMELVEGETLAERIVRGPIPIDEAQPLFIQIAEGLEAAHEKGVIHRDLKPANVKITPDGKVKILDFGLAKTLLEEAPEADGSQSPTLTKGTALGVIMGTASYMSPEQARGKTVDKRTDIWAFGCCLYEALTGRQAFGGETVSDMISAVLRTEPSFDAVPPAVRPLVRRCLQGDPLRRLRDIGEARIALAECPADVLVQREQVAGAAKRIALLSLVSAVASGLIVWTLTRGSHDVPRPARLTLELPNIAPSRAAIFGFSLFQLDISPDGAEVVYVAETEAGRQLRIRSLDEMSPQPIPNTGGASAAFVSPDGRWIGFHADGELKRVASDGSQLLTLCKAPAFAGASWGTEDAIVFAGRDGLYRIASRGGEAELVASPDPDLGENLFGWPDVLPGGEALLVTALMEGAIVDDPRARIVAVSLETGERHVVAEAGSNARYLPTGHVVYGLGGRLYAVGFDAERLEPRGAPVPVLEGVRSDPFVGTDFVVSHQGALVYARAAALGSPAKIMWVGRHGSKEALIDELRPFRFPRLSPDGERLAVAIGAPGQSDIWVYDLTTVPPLGRRLTSEGNNSVPIWTPDGERVLFASNADGPRNLYWTRADGSMLEPERLLTSALPQHPLFVTPDGSEVVLYQNHPDRKFDIWAFPMDGGEGRTVVQTPFFEGQGALSPSGNWLVYTSEIDGDGYQVYVRSFAGPGGAIRISRNGGTEPAWSHDGRELYFTDAGRMMAVAVEETGSELRHDGPRALFEGFLQGGGPRSYDVGRDGRFVVVTGDSDLAEPDELVIVVNWFAELERLVPAAR